jgi:drug/metabolite transporter (DMT)-like permease
VRRWYLILMAVSTGWGTIPLVLSRISLAPANIAFGRVAIASVAIGGVLLIQGRSEGRGPVRPPRPYSVMPLRCAFNGFLLAIHWLTMFIAFDRVSAGTVILIIFVAPVGVALTAPRTLGEHVSRRTVMAAFVGLAGVALIAGPALDQADPLGVAMAVVSMLVLVVLNLSSKSLAGIYGGRRLAFIETAGAAVALLPVVVFADWSGLGRSWPWLLLLGLVHTALAVSLYLAAMGRMPVTHLSIISYLEPASVVVLAWLVLSEVPRLGTIIGGALVVAAGALVVVGDRRVATPPEPVHDPVPLEGPTPEGEVLDAAR